MNENRLPQNGHVDPDTSGAVRLDSSLLRDRVREIMDARLSAPFAPAHESEVSESMTVAYGGQASSVNVDVVRDRVEQSRWSLIATLRARGVTQEQIDAGEFAIEGWRTGQTPQGVPACMAVLRWRPRKSEQSKPLLSIVPD